MFDSVIVEALIFIFVVVALSVVTIILAFGFLLYFFSRKNREPKKVNFEKHKLKTENKKELKSFNANNHL